MSEKVKPNRNEVNLPERTKKILTALAVKENHSLKSYCELVLIKHGDKYEKSVSEAKEALS